MPCHLWSTWCSPKVEHVAIFLAARRSKGWPEHQHTAQFKQKSLVSPSAQHRLSATPGGPPPLPMQGLAPSPSLPRTWASAGRSPHRLSQMAAQCFRKNLGIFIFTKLHKASGSYQKVHIARSTPPPCACCRQLSRTAPWWVPGPMKKGSASKPSMGDL